MRDSTRAFDVCGAETVEPAGVKSVEIDLTARVN
jgi:hypothetical protein